MTGAASLPPPEASTAAEGRPAVYPGGLRNASAAAAAFAEAGRDLVGRLTASASGRELVARGWSHDIEMAAAHDARASAARSDGGAFVREP